jgi:hypothetical protein
MHLKFGKDPKDAAMRFNSKKTLSFLLACSLTLSIALADEDRKATSAASLFEKAVAAQNTKNFAGAEQHYRQLVKEFPDNPLAPGALVSLVRVLGQTGKAEEGLKFIELGKNKYTKVPGLVDQLDALKIHLGSRMGKNNNKAKAKEKFQARMNEMKKRLAAAKEAGNGEEVKESSKALARMQKQWENYGKDQKNNKKKKSKGSKPGQINAEEARREQEALILKAHELEDQGKTEEAYSLRQKADEIAARLEESRRRPKKGKGKKSRNKNNEKRRMVERRLKEVRGEVKKINAALEEGKKSGNEEQAKELIAVRQNLQREAAQLQRQMQYKKKGGSKNVRRELKKLKKSIKKDTASLKKATNKGQTEKAAGLLKRLESNKLKLQKLETNNNRQEKVSRNRQLSRLSKNLKRQGLSEEEIAQRLDFAGTEQELMSKHSEEIDGLADKLRENGTDENQIKETVTKERQEFQRSVAQRRRQFNKEIGQARKKRQQEQEAVELEERVGRRKSELTAEGADEATVKSELRLVKTEFSKELSQRRVENGKKRQEVMRRYRVQTNEDRLKQHAERLRKRGLSEDEIKKRVQAMRDKFMSSLPAKNAEKAKKKVKNSKNKKNKKKKGKGRKSAVDNVQKIKNLENEVKRLRRMVERLQSERENQAPTSRPIQ